MSTRSKNLFGTRDLERRLKGRTIRAFLRDWRRTHEMSQAAFARKLGMSRANLCDIERGRKGVGPEKAAEIAAIVGYSVHVLVEMAIEEQLEASGLRFSVSLKPAV